MLTPGTRKSVSRGVIERRRSLTREFCQGKTSGSLGFKPLTMSDLFDRVLQFKPSLRLEVLDPGRAFLLGEREQFMLTGPVQVRVASTLDGRRPVRNLITALEGQVSSPEVLYTLSQWEKRGYVVESAPALPPEAAAFWQAQGVAPADVATRLASTPVTVRALDGLDPAPLIEALGGAGLTVKETAALPVVLVRDYLTPELEAFNHRALEQRQPWFLVKSSGATPWVGPVFRPGEGPCWACLAQRLRSNRPVETYLRERTGVTGPLLPPRAELPASLQAGVHLAAVSLARWLVAGRQGPLSQTLLALEFQRFQLTEHAVVRRPQCPACGDEGLLKARGARPIVLEPRPRGFTEDNGFRSVTPEETFARLQHQISPVTGILSSLAPLAGRDHPLRPTYGASFFTPVHIEEAGFSEFHSFSLGKGRTPAQSRASALGEGIERWSAIFQGDEPRTRARLAQLGEEAIDPRGTLLLQRLPVPEPGSPQQERTACTLGAVPRPFDEGLELDWTPLWSLTHERRRYLPTSCCYINYPAPPRGALQSLGLQWPRGRQLPGGGHPPGLPGAGRARCGGHLVVRPSAPPRGGPEQLPGALLPGPAGALPRPGLAAVGAGPHA